MPLLRQVGFVYSINAKPKTDGERGIPKHHVDYAFVTSNGLEGDFCVHRAGKDDYLDRAILVLPMETLLQFNSAGWHVDIGDLGENITTSGVSYWDFSPGKKYKIGGTVEIQITKPCRPCGNLRMLPYVGDRLEEFKRFLMPDDSNPDSNRRGWYARVLQEGTIRINDIFDVFS